MCLLKMPILTNVSWVVEGVNGLDIRLTKPQKANLIRFLSALVLLNTMALSSVASWGLGIISVNALSHFMSHSGLSGELLMASAVRFAVQVMSLKGVAVKLAIDDTMEHHSKFCKCVANVYNLFDHALGTYCQAKCIVFAYLACQEFVFFVLLQRFQIKTTFS